MLKYYSDKLNTVSEIKERVVAGGITVNGKSYKGYTEEKLRETLQKDGAEDIDPNAIAVVLESEDKSKSYSFTMDQLGVKRDVDSVVQSVMSYSDTENEKDILRRQKALNEGGVAFDTLVYSRDKVEQAVSDISSQIYVKAQNATEVRQNGAFVVSEAKTGYEIDSEELTQRIIALFDKHEFGKTLSFAIKVTEPTVKTDAFVGADKLIGSYSSTYSSSDVNRTQNLRNGCEKINGVIVYPGEEFSTNDHFNPCTEENGWANAGTIVDGQIEDSIGGGMCQVSTMLYDALLEAELQIVQRYNHSMKVGYAPYAFDATLAGDYKDLKFKNDTSKPVYIEAYLTSGRVCVNIYGEEVHEAGRTVELRNELVEVTEPGEPVKKNDSDMYEGETRVVHALNGLTYELYKDIYVNGVFKESVKVNTSVYSPRRETTYVGIKRRSTSNE